MRDAHPVDAKDLEEYIRADLDYNGRIIGIEILHATERLGKKWVGQVNYEYLPLTMENDLAQE